MLSGAGMQVAVLLGAAALLAAVWLVLHFVMVVQGFKTSAGWGLAALLVPFGSLAFAFARSGRRALAWALLAAFLGATACGAAGGWQLARALSLEAVPPGALQDADEAGKKGMDEFDEQVQDLGNLEDIKL